MTRLAPPAASPMPLVRPTRRAVLRVGALGMGFGLTLGDFFRLRDRTVKAAEPGNPVREGPAKSVIQIFLGGGCSHIDSWDPKPEAPVEYRGSFGVAKTKIPGVVFGEHLARCGQVLDKMTVVRTVTGRIPDHGQAQYHLLTGYTPTPAIQHPAMGAVVAHRFGPRNNLPPFVGVPFAASAAGTGYLGSRYGAFDVAADPGGEGFKVRDVSLPAGVTPERFDRRRAARAAVEDRFRTTEADPAMLDSADEFYRRAYSLVSSPEAQRAFTLDGESAETLALYGDHRHPKTKQPIGIGRRCLLARRLIEAGTRFVSVFLDGFDTHILIKNTLEVLLPAVDQAVAGLITDLDRRGLLDSTLVMLVTEFGRSPKINVDAGRDHYARAFSAVLAGGGIKRGQVYGATDATASEPARDAVPVEDLLHTVYRQIGIDADERLMAPGDRPIDIVRGGKLVKGLIA